MRKARIYTPRKLTEKEFHGRLSRMGIPAWRRKTKSGFEADGSYVLPRLEYTHRDGKKWTLIAHNWPELWTLFAQRYGNWIESTRRDIAKFDAAIESFKKRRPSC